MVIMNLVGIIIFITVAIILGLVVVLILAHLIQAVRQLVTDSPPSLPLPDLAVQQLIAQLNLQPNEVVYDLGCGTGQLLLALSKSQPKLQLVGIDHDWLVLLIARWLLRGRGISLKHHDLLTVDLSSANVIICYLNPALMSRLEADLGKGMKSGSRLISADYPLPQRRSARTIHIKTDHTRGRTLYLYKF